MVLVTPNIPNNTIFAMSQTTELYYLSCSFQNIEFDDFEISVCEIHILNLSSHIYYISQP